jgi:hypothetical protein
MITSSRKSEAGLDACGLHLQQSAQMNCSGAILRMNERPAIVKQLDFSHPVIIVLRPATYIILPSSRRIELPETAKDFQSIVFALQKYWVDWGCTLWQPYYSQLGAGTMNPATFLRVLGPEPWNVAYLEPSVRPDDGRYGENPNRL